MKKLPKVTVVGAGNVGAEAARQLVQKDVANVVLIDVVDGLPQGKALDMLQAGGVEDYSAQIVGTNNYADTKDSDLIIITAGLARKPGMSRDDLLHANAKIMTSVVEQAAPLSPNAILLIVSNPLDAMTYLAQKVSGFPYQRVLGMAPLLDLARMETFIAQELNVPVKEVKAQVLGTHGDDMVPLPSYSTVSGKPLTELLPKEKIDAINKRTANGGAEIVALLKTGSAYYAPASAAAYMATAILQNRQETISSCVHVNGEYGIKDLYTGFPAVLGKKGVEKIIELKLAEEEKALLTKSAESVRSNLTKLGY
jgi:malate dehydrogenase